MTTPVSNPLVDSDELVVCPVDCARGSYWMNFKNEYSVPAHLRDGQGLPRNREERLLWIKQKVEEGYYDSDRVMQAVAEAFLEPYDVRRAGDKSWRGGGGAAGERT